MFKETSMIRGIVTATVYGPDGKIKERERGIIRKILGLPAELMISVNHNIVTTIGDRLIADAISFTHARHYVDGTTGQMQVGTGFISAGKGSVGLTTPTGTAQTLDATYPKLKAVWGNADASHVLYQVLFAAGSLNANGINEAVLVNDQADALAYAEITPAVNCTLVDSLQISWELIFLGA